MHVSPAKHSYVWLPRKCDYRTDERTDGQTDAGQSDPYVPLCFAGDIKTKCNIQIWFITSVLLCTSMEYFKTRGPKGHISCTWVQCATFLTDQPGPQFLFTHRPEKHKIGRRRWDLTSCQVSLNSVQGFREEVENVSANQRPGRPSCFSDWPEKHKLGRGR